MCKIMSLVSALILALMLCGLPEAGAVELTEPEQTQSEPEAEPDEGPERSGSMVPMEPEGNMQDSLGMQLSSQPETEGRRGSPWGGILFFIAAIALGVGLAIARSKK